MTLQERAHATNIQRRDAHARGRRKDSEEPRIPERACVWAGRSLSGCALFEQNIGNHDRAVGIRKAREHSPLTRWFEQWNEDNGCFDFCLIWNPNVLTTFEI